MDRSGQQSDGSLKGQHRAMDRFMQGQNGLRSPSNGAMDRSRANSDASLTRQQRWIAYGPTAMDRLTANSDGSLKVVAGPDCKQRAPISELQLPSPLLDLDTISHVSSSWNIYIYTYV